MSSSSGARTDAAGATTAAVLRNIELWKPIIAAINGYCLAGGLELALACDIRIASENAAFALTEVTRGIIPGNGGTQILPRVVPPGIALEMMFTGQHIDAKEAYRVGLVNRVVPQGEVDDGSDGASRSHQRERADSDPPREGSGAEGLDLPLMDGLRMESLFSMFVHTTEDAKEGPRAFRREAEGCLQGALRVADNLDSHVDNAVAERRKRLEGGHREIQRVRKGSVVSDADVDAAIVVANR